MSGLESGGQPDQQGRPEAQAAPADQSYMEYDSVISDEVVLASEDSAAVDSADGSADQEGSSDEYSEVGLHPTTQSGATGKARDADAGAPAGGVQQVGGETGATRLPNPLTVRRHMAESDECSALYGQAGKGQSSLPTEGNTKKRHREKGRRYDVRSKFRF